MRRVFVAGLLAFGCGDDSSPAGVGSGPPLPWARAALPTTPQPADNPSTPAKVELGRLLFYDPITSTDGAVACATCHSEVWGMSDGLPLSIGVGGVGPTGPGRTGPTSTRRNAQTLWNVAFRERLFWDGRASSLEEQALEPLRTEHELGRNPDELVTELSGFEEYANLFNEAFPGGGVSVAGFVRAVAAFERTLVTKLAPYDRYVAGDTGALGDQAVRGLFLFAEVGCAGCHVPPRFESERYALRGVSSGRGDAGRFEVTGREADRDHFRVPTLRNLRDTGPFFHDGSATSLLDAVAHEVAQSVSEGESRALAADEVEAIAVFLDEGLMDRGENPYRPERVPSGLPVPVDGFRIPR